MVVVVVVDVAVMVLVVDDAEIFTFYFDIIFCKQMCGGQKQW